ncbi:hypothetical protein Agub_g6583, partial [Astrephomene gubernaculifera]
MKHNLRLCLAPGQQDLTCCVTVDENAFGKRLLKSAAGLINVASYWSTKPIAPLAVLHLASNGRGTQLRLMPPSEQEDQQPQPGKKKQQRAVQRARAALQEAHAACLEGRSALRAPLSLLPKATQGANGQQRQAAVPAVAAEATEAVELFLVPLAAQEAQRQHAEAAAEAEAGPVFWGYVLPAGAAAAALRALRERRLAVVASVENDGPIVRSYTVQQLEEELAAAKTRCKSLRGELNAALAAQQKQQQQQPSAGGRRPREAAAAEDEAADTQRGKKKRRLQGDGGSSAAVGNAGEGEGAGPNAAAAAAGAADGEDPTVARLRAAVAAAVSYMKRVQEDLRLLREYVESKAVTYGGREHKARLERAPRPGGGGGVVKRPVIRIPLTTPSDANATPATAADAGSSSSSSAAAVIALTRADPKRPETSMLVRVRPYWQQLQDMLAGKLLAASTTEAGGDGDGGAAANGGEEVAAKKGNAKKARRAAQAAAAAEEGAAAEARSRLFDFLPWISPDRDVDSAMALWQVLDPEGDVVPADELLPRLAHRG